MRNKPRAHAYGVDANGCPTERFMMGDTEVVVHYDDVPESDVTSVDGIRCTTPLRTVIDLAAEVSAADLEAMVNECIAKRLFTVADALRRVDQPDMRTRPGARRLRELIARI